MVCNKHNMEAKNDGCSAEERTLREAQVHMLTEGKIVRERTQTANRQTDNNSASLQITVQYVHSIHMTMFLFSQITLFTLK